MQNISETLGTLVKEARMSRNLTQERLAEIIKKSDRTIINIEKGQGNPKLDSLEHIVNALKLDPNSLFYPANEQDCPMLQRLRHEIADCSEKEAAALIPVVQAVLSALRDEDQIIFNR